MSGCQHDCQGRDQQAYRVAMTQRVIVACAEHRAYLEAEGITLVPVDRRSQAVPVARDRRRWLPTWRRNAAAKDMTGATR